MRFQRFLNLPFSLGQMMWLHRVSSTEPPDYSYHSQHTGDAFVDRLPRDPVQVRVACVALVVVTEGAEVDTIVVVLVG